jgi:hypothetical protein
LIFSAIFLLIGVQVGILAFIGDLIAVNRNLLEDIQYRLRKLEQERANLINKTKSKSKKQNKA